MDLETFNKAEELRHKIFKYKRRLEVLESKFPKPIIIIAQSDVEMGRIIEDDIRHMIIEMCREKLARYEQEFEML